MQSVASMYESQDHTDSHSPPESRRYLAEAIKKGFIEVQIITCVITGPAGVGKTCLEFLLLCRKPPTIRHSTGCAERPIRAVSGIRIQLFDGGWKVVTEEELEEMLARYIPILCDSLPDEHISSGILESLLQQQKATLNFKGKTTPTFKSKSTPEFLDKTANFFSDAPKQATNCVLDDLVKRMNKLSSSDSSYTDKLEKSRELSGSKWIHLIDSGGQPEFYDPTRVRWCVSAKT